MKTTAKYMLSPVENQPELWDSGDPVRPELDVDFKTAPGRGVFGLMGLDGDWKAFLCYARTTEVPQNIEELVTMTDPDGSVVVPYTVWSYERGAGSAIIKEVITMIKNIDMRVTRVVTLSPQTEMAEKFHLRNGAKIFRTNATTVNFEYELPPKEET